jgi:hypothetical protein
MTAEESGNVLQASQVENCHMTDLNLGDGLICTNQILLPTEQLLLWYDWSFLWRMSRRN